MTRSKNLLPIESLDPLHLKYILCDIDDTLTNEGQLFSEAYESLWNLKNAGYKIIPVTGRPAGWCEMMARLWPVEAIVGENGAFAFYYKNKKMNRIYSQSIEERSANKIKLEKIAKEILNNVPGSAIASDQFCRSVDLAIDFCEDVPHLSESAIHKILDIFKSHGATAKVSSIHVNGWFGEHNKLGMSLQILKNIENLTDLKDIQEQVLFIGDSPNDEPMFEYFKNSVGVQNILEFQSHLKYKPTYVCSLSGGYGFQEMTNFILKKKS